MTVPEAGSWAVTHVPTGTAIANLVADLAFWDAIRIARALEDCALFPTAALSADVEDYYLVTAVVGAALHDHYVFPLFHEEVR